MYVLKVSIAYHNSVLSLMFSPQSDDALATFFLNMFETGLQVEAQSDQVGFFVAVVIVVVVVWGV